MQTGGIPSALSLKILTISLRSRTTRPPFLKPKKDAAKGSSSLDDLDFDEDDEETEVEMCIRDSLRPKERPYQTNNFYTALARQERLDKEVRAIVKRCV